MAALQAIGLTQGNVQAPVPPVQRPCATAHALDPTPSGELAAVLPPEARPRYVQLQPAAFPTRAPPSSYYPANNNNDNNNNSDNNGSNNNNENNDNDNNKGDDAQHSSGLGPDPNPSPSAVLGSDPGPGDVCSSSDPEDSFGGKAPCGARPAAAALSAAPNKSRPASGGSEVWDCSTPPAPETAGPSAAAAVASAPPPHAQPQGAIQPRQLQMLALAALEPTVPTQQRRQQQQQQLHLHLQPGGSTDAAGCRGATSATRRDANGPSQPLDSAVACSGTPVAVVVTGRRSRRIPRPAAALRSPILIGCGDGGAKGACSSHQRQQHPQRRKQCQASARRGAGGGTSLGALPGRGRTCAAVRSDMHLPWDGGHAAVGSDSEEDSELGQGPGGSEMGGWRGGAGAKAAEVDTGGADGSGRQRKEANEHMRGCGGCRFSEDIPAAPVFYPAPAEFVDPLLYIAKIRPEAEQYGICCIVPPACCWDPPPLRLEAAVVTDAGGGNGRDGSQGDTFFFRTQEQVLGGPCMWPRGADDEQTQTQARVRQEARQPQQQQQVGLNGPQQQSQVVSSPAPREPPAKSGAGAGTGPSGYDATPAAQVPAPAGLRLVAPGCGPPRPRPPGAAVEPSLERYLAGRGAHPLLDAVDHEAAVAGVATAAMTAGSSRYEAGGSKMARLGRRSCEAVGASGRRRDGGLHEESDGHESDMNGGVDGGKKIGLGLGTWSGQLRSRASFHADCRLACSSHFGMPTVGDLCQGADGEHPAAATIAAVDATAVGLEPSLEEVEAEFWRVVEQPPGECGQVETLQYDRNELASAAAVTPTTSGGGSASGIKGASSSPPSTPPAGEDERARRYARHPWNPSNLPYARGSLLQYMELQEPIRGVTVPRLHVGSFPSAHCWHAEQHAMYSVSYLHRGAPKVWYSVPARAAEQLKQAATLHVAAPQRTATDPLTLHQRQRDAPFMSPRELCRRGVPVYRLVQEAGSFVVTFPRTQTAGFSSGSNCGQDVRLAPVDWLPHACAAARQDRARGVAIHRRPATAATAFSLDALLVRLVAAAPAAAAARRVPRPTAAGAAVSAAAAAEASVGEGKAATTLHAGVGAEEFCGGCGAVKREVDYALDGAAGGGSCGPRWCGAGRQGKTGMGPAELPPAEAMHTAVAELAVRLEEEALRWAAAREFGVAQERPMSSAVMCRAHTKTGTGAGTCTAWMGCGSGGGGGCLVCGSDLYLSAVVSQQQQRAAACPEHAAGLGAPPESCILLVRHSLDELLALLASAKAAFPEAAAVAAVAAAPQLTPTIEPHAAVVTPAAPVRPADVTEAAPVLSQRGPPAAGLERERQRLGPRHALFLEEQQAEAEHLEERRRARDRMRRARAQRAARRNAAEHDGAAQQHLQPALGLPSRAAVAAAVTAEAEAATTEAEAASAVAQVIPCVPAVAGIAPIGRVVPLPPAVLTPTAMSPLQLSVSPGSADGSGLDAAAPALPAMRSPLAASPPSPAQVVVPPAQSTGAPDKKLPVQAGTKRSSRGPPGQTLPAAEAAVLAAPPAAATEYERAVRPRRERRVPRHLLDTEMELAAEMQHVVAVAAAAAAAAAAAPPSLPPLLQPLSPTAPASPAAASSGGGANAAAASPRGPLASSSSSGLPEQQQPQRQLQQRPPFGTESKSPGESGGLQAGALEEMTAQPASALPATATAAAAAAAEHGLAAPLRELHPPAVVVVAAAASAAVTSLTQLPFAQLQLQAQLQTQLLQEKQREEQHQQLQGPWPEPEQKTLKLLNLQQLPLLQSQLQQPRPQQLGPTLPQAVASAPEPQPALPAVPPPPALTTAAAPPLARTDEVAVVVSPRRSSRPTRPSVRLLNGATAVVTAATSTGGASADSARAVGSAATPPSVAGSSAIAVPTPAPAAVAAPAAPAPGVLLLRRETTSGPSMGSRGMAAHRPSLPSGLRGTAAPGGLPPTAVPGAGASGAAAAGPVLQQPPVSASRPRLPPSLAAASAAPGTSASQISDAAAFFATVVDEGDVESSRVAGAAVADGALKMAVRSAAATASGAVQPLAPAAPPPILAVHPVIDGVAVGSGIVMEERPTSPVVRLTGRTGSPLIRMAPTGSAGQAAHATLFGGSQPPQSQQRPTATAPADPAALQHGFKISRQLQQQPSPVQMQGASAASAQPNSVEGPAATAVTTAAAAIRPVRKRKTALSSDMVVYGVSAALFGAHGSAAKRKAGADRRGPAAAASSGSHSGSGSGASGSAGSSIGAGVGPSAEAQEGPGAAGCEESAAAASAISGELEDTHASLAVVAAVVRPAFAAGAAAGDGIPAVGKEGEEALRRGAGLLSLPHALFAAKDDGPHQAPITASPPPMAAVLAPHDGGDDTAAATAAAAAAASTGMATVLGAHTTQDGDGALVGLLQDELEAVAAGCSAPHNLDLLGLHDHDQDTPGPAPDPALNADTDAEEDVDVFVVCPTGHHLLGLPTSPSASALEPLAALLMPPAGGCGNSPRLAAAEYGDGVDRGGGGGLEATMAARDAPVSASGKPAQVPQPQPWFGTGETAFVAAGPSGADGAIGVVGYTPQPVLMPMGVPSERYGGMEAGAIAGVSHEAMLGGGDNVMGIEASEGPVFAAAASAPASQLGLTGWGESSLAEFMELDCGGAALGGECLNGSRLGLSSIGANAAGDGWADLDDLVFL